MKNKFYISDTHFKHRGIIRYDRMNAGGNYPFSTIEERDAAITERWNTKIDNGDVVYILGDFAYANQSQVIELLSKLNGKKVFVMGNHDKAWMPTLVKYTQTRLKKVCWYDKIKDGNDTVVLSHYPIYNWDGQHSGAYLVYGHVHASAEEGIFQQAGQLMLANHIPEFRAANAGCMLNGFVPVTLEELKVRYGFGRSWSSD